MAYVMLVSSSKIDSKFFEIHIFLLACKEINTIMNTSTFYFQNVVCWKSGHRPWPRPGGLCLRPLRQTSATWPQHVPKHGTMLCADPLPPRYFTVFSGVSLLRTCCPYISLAYAPYDHHLAQHGPNVSQKKRPTMASTWLQPWSLSPSPSGWWPAVRHKPLKPLNLPQAPPKIYPSVHQVSSRPKTAAAPGAPPGHGAGPAPWPQDPRAWAERWASGETVGSCRQFQETWHINGNLRNMVFSMEKSQKKKHRGPLYQKKHDKN